MITVSKDGTITGAVFFISSLLAFSQKLRQPDEGMGSIIPIKCRATFHKIVKMWSAGESCVSEFRAAPGDTCVSKFRVTPGDTCPDMAIRILRQNLALTIPPSSRQKKRLLFCSPFSSLSQKLTFELVPIIFVLLKFIELVFLSGSLFLSLQNVLCDF